ncbi:MAG: patatin-like phospholipase family protein [Nostocoides sp.]
MTTAFVLSGGGSLGAVQVGMLQALAARGIAPDLLVGTSAGAINAAFVAGRGTGEAALAHLETAWAGTRFADVFPVSPSRPLLAVAGRRSSFFGARGLRRVIEGHLTFERLQDAPIPLHVVATDLLTGNEVLLSAGRAVDAILASTAIPAILPPVRIDGRLLVDGGLADNTAISQAVHLGADRVFVLPGGAACALAAPPSTPFGVALHALTLLVQQRLAHDIRAYAGQVELHLLPPLCPLRVAPTDFGHGAELVQTARAASARWLDGPDRTVVELYRFLSGHDHTAEHLIDLTSAPVVGASRSRRHTADRIPEE